MEFRPVRFIQEDIQVHYIKQPLLEKKGGCPDEFSWRGEVYIVEEIISEWHDYKRRGRMERNMQPQHAEVAQNRGSWGVGQDYYRVRTGNGKYFDIYYDRAPKDATQRKGAWFLEREIAPVIV